MFARYLPGACWWRFARRRCLWLQIVSKHDPHSFALLPRGWVVERTFAWLGRYRRHSKDYEQTTESSEAMIYISMIHLMSRRLARAKC